MKIGSVAVMIIALLAPMPNMGHGSLLGEQQEPERCVPRPPRTPLRFKAADRSGTQSVEIRFPDSRTISFRFDKSGTCNRHEEGTAKIRAYWWLGAESDENEAGEEVGVTEYVYDKDNKCSIYLRIDEGQWQQATVSEAGECGKNCPISTQPMHLKMQ
jgi:hypothetical protein